MEKTQLIALAQAALSENFERVNSLLNFALPEESIHWIWLGSMKEELMTLEDAVELFLGPTGDFPAIIDLVVAGILDGQTLVAWLRSGHPDVHDIEQTWNEGYGPFKPMGIMTPSALAPGQKLNFAQLERLAEKKLRFCSGI